MTAFTLSYQVGRPTGICAATGQALQPGSWCMASLCEREEDQGLERKDLSMAAWEQGQRPQGLFSYWKTRVPEPQSQQRLLVDNEVLVNLFDRLADDPRPQRVAFRFVLMLILMRKRLLKYLGREGEAGTERWLLARRGSEPGASPVAPPVAVVNPHLADEDIRQITDQLGEILQAEV